MKRFLPIIIAFVLICSFAYAEIDFSSMSNDEIITLINSARNELTLRSAKEEEKIFLIDSDGIQVYLTGNIEIEYNEYVCLEVIFINNTNETLCILPEYCVLNGWQTYCDIIGETNAKAKKKDALELLMSDAEITKLSEIETIEFSFYSSNQSTYETKELGKVSLIFDGEKLMKVE